MGVIIFFITSDRKHHIDRQCNNQAHVKSNKVFEALIKKIIIH